MLPGNPDLVSTVFTFLSNLKERKRRGRTEIKEKDKYGN